MTQTTSRRSARFGGLFVAARRFAARQFWGGHPNTFRSFFAWASLSIAFYFATEGKAFDAHGYELMQLTAPHSMWAAMFFVHWLCISLVVLTHRRRSVRVGVQLIVNCYGMFIWSLYVVLQDMAFGHFAINASAERIMVIYSIWALVRTGMSRQGDD